MYSTLNRAQLSYDYLHTNSTTHEFLFGALAELVDNARDAQATRLDVFGVRNGSVRGDYILCVLDDGDGMSPVDAANVITFGLSSKRGKDGAQIGMYGNGLKSGSMRLGNDLVIFTKRDNILTCLFLSRTFHEEESLVEVIVPLPSWNEDRSPLDGADEKYKIELELILKYSPFKSEQELLSQFDKISTDSGTLVMLYNLKLLDNGEPELKLTTDDIVLTNPPTDDFDTDQGLQAERSSFRTYCSVLYFDPRMKIYIQQKKVLTRKLLLELHKTRKYSFSSARFKTRSEADAVRAEEEARSLDFRAKEAESKARDMSKRCGSALLARTEVRADLRKVEAEAARLRQAAQLKKQQAERKKKSLKDPKSLTFYFGLRIGDRTSDGMFLYNCGRLIKMHVLFPQQHTNNVMYRGVVGVVDVPYLVLEPTHNKQDFADAKEFRLLQKALGDYLDSYWAAVGLTTVEQCHNFWEVFGYSKNLSVPPSNELKFVRKRRSQLPQAVQCNDCLKWRTLPFTLSAPETYPDTWTCASNPDPQHNRCSAGETKVIIADGVYQRAEKNVSASARTEKLEEEIRKKQELLTKLNPPVKQPPPQQHDSRLRQSAPVHYKAVAVSAPVDHPKRHQPAPRARSPPRRAEVSSSTVRSSSPPTKQQRRNKSQARQQAPPLRRPVRPQREEVISSSSEEEGGEDEEEEEEVETRKTRKEPRTRVRQASSNSADSPDDSSAGRPPPKLGRANLSLSDVRSTLDKEKGSAVAVTSTVSSNVETTVSQPADSSLPSDRPRLSVGAGSWVEVEDEETEKWSPAQVVELQDTSARLKFSGGESDKWFALDSPRLRLLPQFSSAEHDGTSPQTLTKLLDGYRQCLKYFLPPDWKVMNKPGVAALSPEELAAFPLNDFFDQYESGLKKLVSKIRKDGDTTKQQLSSLRANIGVLLARLNPEMDGDLEDSDIDTLLLQCIAKTEPTESGE